MDALFGAPVVELRSQIALDSLTAKCCLCKHGWQMLAAQDTFYAEVNGLPRAGLARRHANLRVMFLIQLVSTCVMQKV